jgi:hypothetical protein
MVGCRCTEVRDKPVANVLIGIAALRFVVELILRKVVESCEVPIVDDMGIGVVGIEAEILA